MTQKKNFLIRVLGLSALVLGTSGFAGGVECPPVKAEPAVSGFVVGVEGGYADTNWDWIDRNAFRSGDLWNRNHAGFGLRPYVGYQQSQYLAYELGWTHLPWAKFSRLNPLDNTAIPLTNITNWAVDASLRLSLPLSKVLSAPVGVFTRMGVAYFVSDGVVEWRANALESLTVRPTKIQTGVYNTMVGLGAYADVTPHLRVELAWTHFIGTTILGDLYQPSPDFYSLGLSYRF